MIEDADQRCYPSANQVIRERPEITLVPDLAEVSALRHGNDARNGKRINKEVTDGGDGNADREGLAIHAQDVIHAISDRDGDVHRREIESDLQHPRAPPGSP